MARPDTPALLEDILLCLGFFTRFPLPDRAISRPFAEAIWAAPVAGGIVGLLVGLMFSVCLALGVPATVASVLALATGLLATGALHEDGLADVADGFGGGRDRERKLEIMRDSRIGTYGVAALGLSLLLRWAALASLAALSFWSLLAVCIAAHAGSRAVLPAFLAAVPPARSDGLGAGVGIVSPQTAGVALALGAVALLVCGFQFTVITTCALAVVFLGLSRLCRSQIGGQTGDVLGALQQTSEAAILVIASSTFGTPT